MRINWSVRFANPHWWFQLAISVGAPVLAYFGVNWQDLTSWQMILDILGQAVRNPVVVVSALVAIYNAVVDPTTKGASDSEHVLLMDKM